MLVAAVLDAVAALGEPEADCREVFATVDVPAATTETLGSACLDEFARIMGDLVGAGRGEAAVCVPVPPVVSPASFVASDSDRFSAGFELFERFAERVIRTASGVLVFILNKKIIMILFRKFLIVFRDSVL